MSANFEQELLTVLTRIANALELATIPPAARKIRWLNDRMKVYVEHLIKRGVVDPEAF